MIDDVGFDLIGRQTPDRYIKIGSERVYVIEFRKVPAGGQLGFEFETSEPCGAYAEQSFGYDAAEKSALGRQVALATFRPCFHRVGYMVA